jgi:hypothetical protein
LLDTPPRAALAANGLLKRQRDVEVSLFAKCARLIRGFCRLRKSIERKGMSQMSSFRELMAKVFALLIASVCASGVLAGPALDALDGRWSPTDCNDPGTGTWSVFGNQIQFFWPTDPDSDALEVVTREDSDVVETEVVSPDKMKGRRYRYQIVGDQVLIDDLSENKQQVVRRCGR